MIPVTRPSFSGKEIKYIKSALASGWVTQGPFVERFEGKVKGISACRFAIATTSCTSALHLALLAAGIGPGDRILLPSFTFIATANAVEYTGAVPVFCDIDLETFNISIVSLKKVLSKQKSGDGIRAIIPVHLFGLCAPMPDILELAKKRNIVVIEDAACALGASIKNKMAGSFGKAGCFSFHPRKIITTGEGGMVVTNDGEIARKCRMFRNHGADVCDKARHDKGMSLLPGYGILGYNYRMTDIQAAVGIAQIERYKDIQKSRLDTVEFYNKNIQEVPWLIPPSAPEGYHHVYQAYVCRIKKELFSSLGKAHLFRNSVIKFMQNNGIAIRQGTHAVHLQRYYAKKYGLKAEAFPHSLEADYLTLTLPLYDGLKAEDREKIIKKLKQINLSVRM